MAQRDAGGQRPDVRVEPVPLGLKPALRSLLTAYLVEFAERGGEPPPPCDAAGQVVYRWFDDYWSDPAREPLGIWLSEELVGFCLLRDTDAAWSVAEFYVRPSWRRLGVGAAAVALIKARCRATGRYDTLLASTVRWNTSALAFWRARGFQTIAEESERLVNACRLDV